jgi:methyltransferase (TIGR00027 family)
MNDASQKLLESTAGWTAAVRAAESKREDRLFNDPWAEALAGEPGLAWLAERPADSLNAIVIRTRYFDDFLQQITSRQGIGQVVLMAAGLDTRAYRLEWPGGMKLYELDQPGVLQLKEEIMGSQGAKAGCARQSIAADLAGEWKEALLASGFNPQDPSAWLLEGFLFYIPSETIVKILTGVSGLAASESWLGFDAINGMVLTSPWTMAWVDMQAQSGAPWIGTLEDPQGFLASLGWTATLTQAGQPDANYGRWTLPVIPTDMANMPHNWLVTARKE